MAGFELDLSEVRELAAAIERESGRVGGEVSRAVRARAQQTEASAKGHAPRRTGALAGSIGTDLYGDGRSTGLTAVIGPTIRYGLFQEYGTAKMSANPFMGPAFDEVSPLLQGDIERIAGGVDL